MISDGTQMGIAIQQDLLKAITEEIKLPLLQIARIAELARLVDNPIDAQHQLRVIEHGADAALQIIDSYLFGIQLVGVQQALTLEPLSLGSVLSETAHQLSGLAKQYDVDLRIAVPGRQPLVMANRRGLQAAFLSLGSTIITSQPQADNSKRAITFATHQGSNCVVAGIYGQQEAISAKAWQRGRQLYGKARQPISSLFVSSGAGLYVADTIFKAMAVDLRPARHHNTRGLAAKLQLSRQLQLI